MSLIDVSLVLQVGGLIPRGSRNNVFETIYWVFLVLGTLVGIVVIGYMLYNAWKYRDGGSHADDGDDDRPILGEVPSGGGKGRKLFTSFALSAIIVVSLITWTYFTLLYVEDPGGTAAAKGASLQENEVLTVEVVGRQFLWEFNYPNGHTVRNELRVPADRRVYLEVTSADVFHNFGAPGLRVKSDAIPGQTTETWFIAEETGSYQVACFELCGSGHSAMQGSVLVMEPGAFDEWYANTGEDDSSSSALDRPQTAVRAPASAGVAL